MGGSVGTGIVVTEIRFGLDNATSHEPTIDLAREYTPEQRRCNHGGMPLEEGALDESQRSLELVGVR